MADARNDAPTDADAGTRSPWKVRRRQAKLRRRQAKLRRQFRGQDAANRFAIRGTWGFACHVWCHDQDPTGQTAKAYGFGHYPQVGDVIQEGDQYWWVTEAERCRDPHDMWTGKVLLEPDPSLIPVAERPKRQNSMGLIL